MPTAAQVLCRSTVIRYVPPTNSPLARYRGGIRTVMTALGMSQCARDREHVGQESNMTIYISQGRYTAAAIRAMTAKPEDRSEAIAELLAAVGGRLIGWYLTLGRYDWLIVAEAPDERTLVSTVLAAAAGGSLSDITTTVALSAQDTVKAFGQAGELAKKFRSAGADYYGVPVESAGEITTYEVDPILRTTGSGFLSGTAAVRSSQ